LIFFKNVNILKQKLINYANAQELCACAQPESLLSSVYPFYGFLSNLKVISFEDSLILTISLIFLIEVAHFMHEKSIVSR